MPSHESKGPRLTIARAIEGLPLASRERLLELERGRAPGGPPLRSSIAQKAGLGMGAGSSYVSAIA